LVKNKLEDSLPLEGLTVVELGSSLAAPYAARVLADMGAQLIKVEPPEGEAARHWGPPYLDDLPAFFQVFNQNKQSVTVDFTDADQLSRLSDFIVERADVLLQNLRPGVVEKFGIDGATLCARQPKLIYCNVSAYGETGELANLPGYDPLMQAFAGITNANGSEDSGPCRLPAPFIDIGTGLWATMAIFGALERRHRTGHGGVVGASLMETAVTWMTHAVANIMAGGEEPKRTGLRGAILAPNGGYQTADGPLIITTGTPVQFSRLCEVLGEPEIANDPRLNNNTNRMANVEFLEHTLNRLLAKDTRENWSRKLNEAAIPNAPVQSITEAMAHPQLAASGIMQESENGDYALPALPIHFDGQRLPLRTSAPKTGASNALLDEFRKI
jgi:crotonobetainyl-CoA:carnitine CoA-transferase CaiB-like acyl-CoA transferase